MLNKNDRPMNVKRRYVHGINYVQCLMDWSERKFADEQMAATTFRSESFPVRTVPVAQPGELSPGPGLAS